MSLGTLYGIGTGPGDPGLVTVKAAKILGECRHVFAPRAKGASVSTSFEIVREFVHPEAVIHTVLFPVEKDRSEAAERWREAASRIAEVLRTGEDVCYLTLGDTLLYSTYVYMLRALREILPEVRVVTVPGVTSFSAAAALAEFHLGEAKEPVTVVPVSDDLESVNKALSLGGTVVLMKVGKRLNRLLDLLERRGMMEHAVFISHAGMEGERIETDLSRLRGSAPETGHLAVILVHANSQEAP